jgi:ABC-type phosphate/phosphonate transport system substrate-binding protein
MLASLPMYDFPEVREATDALWRAVSDCLGVQVPLERGLSHSDCWRRPDLVFSQSCGYPLTHEFRGILNYVATPHYAADGCEGPLYRSVLLAREVLPLASFRGCRAAVNARDSMSGMLALKLMVHPYTEVLSGSHLESAGMVCSGLAEICAIDCVTLALARRYRPEAVEGLMEVGRSPLVPGLPYVTRAGDVAVLRDVLHDVLADSTLQDHMKRLMITGLSVLEASDYAVIVELEASLVK